MTLGGGSLPALNLFVCKNPTFRDRKNGKGDAKICVAFSITEPRSKREWNGNGVSGWMLWTEFASIRTTPEAHACFGIILPSDFAILLVQNRTLT